jgi:cytochrome c5
MKKLFAVLLVWSAATVSTAAVSAEPNMEKYNKSCVICHASGTANAPKTGDAAAWEPRLAKGMDALLQSVNTGLNAMPPKGMCFDCSTEEYQAMIEFMAKPAE